MKYKSIYYTNFPYMAVFKKKWWWLDWKLSYALLLIDMWKAMGDEEYIKYARKMNDATN